MEKIYYKVDNLLFTIVNLVLTQIRSEISKVKLKLTIFGYDNYTFRQISEELK
jgi:hypothetical protein